MSARQVGTAIGVAASLQNFGVGVSSLSVGLIYDYYQSYHTVLYFLTGISIFSVTLALAWNVHDYTSGGNVNRRRPEEEEAALLGRGPRIMVVQVRITQCSTSNRADSLSTRLQASDDGEQ